MYKKDRHAQAGSVELLIIVLLAVVIFAGVWWYLDFGRSAPAAVSEPEPTTMGNQTSSSATTPSVVPLASSSPQATVQTLPPNPAAATSQYSLIYATGTAAQELGNPGSQFKIQYAAVATIKTSGASNQYPFFNQYFYNPQGNEFFDYQFTAADGSGYLKAVALSVDIYGTPMPFTMTYPVIDPDTGVTDFLLAQKMLPVDGVFTFTPIGSIHPTGRIAFVVPTEATETIVYYPGGQLTIDLQDQTIIATPIGPAVQLSPVTVTAQPLSLYSSNIATYTDPSGAFSVQYPESFTPDNTINGNQGSYLDNTLVDISHPYAPGFVISPVVNGNIYGIDIEYSSPGNPATCENPNNEVSNGRVPPTIINGVDWYKATMLSDNGTPLDGQQGIDDVYQTVQGGDCWAVDFNWSAASNQAPSYNVVDLFEASVLATFHVSNAAALSGTSAYDEGVGY